MLFRIWFYACKLVVVGLALAFLGYATSLPLSSAMGTIGVSIIVSLGIAGGVLGFAGCFGLRSACPFCGQRGLWVQYDRHTIGLECDNCGLVYGNPLLHMKLRIMPGTEPEDTEENVSGASDAG